MDRGTLISAMQKFLFGSKVFCSDGEGGVLTHVSFNPIACRLTHIGVRQGRFWGKTVYVSVETVLDATGQGVNLSSTCAELSCASEREPDGAVFDNRSIVQQAGTTARGTLRLVAVQPENKELAYLVVHHLRPGQDTLLEQKFMKKLETGQITVSVPDATLQNLPPYRPDNELQQEVEKILFDLAPLHVDFRGIKVRVLDSVLYLEGNISSALRGDIVQDQASGVQGLLEIRNHLIGDDKLAGDLALVLAQDSRTHGLAIGVYPRLGVVRLSGAVHNAQQKAIAEEIAGTFPGVRSVVNDLVVDPTATMLHVMSSAEGGEAEDKVPGKYTRHTR